MNAIRLFFKRLRWRYMLQGSTKTELVNRLKSPDEDVADLLWKSYIRQVRDIRELMVIVYDDSHKFDKATRLFAGEIVLAVLRGRKLGFMSLPGGLWTSTENGRLAYLINVGLHLPELRPKASFIVKRYFDPHERRAFADAW